MIAGRDEGIDLNAEFCWVVSGVRQPEPFFRSLSLLLPQNSVLYFEGCSIGSDVSAFYESHRAPNAVAVCRDTIFPFPDSFHVGFSPEVATRLCELATNRASNELFDHIKAYRAGSMLFTFHDAFENDLLISGLIEELALAEFCRRLAVNYKRETNVNNRDPELLRRLLQDLDR
jgi:hypothetical protein